RRRHTRSKRDWSSDVCSSDLITESIVQEGMINLDFNDVKTVMSQQGMAMMGVGVSSGDNRAREATQEAISSPLLDDIDLSGAKGILVNITGGPGLAIGEYYEIGGMIREFVNDDPTKIGRAHV